MVYGVYMKRKQVMLTPELNYQLEQLAKKRGSSASLVVREALAVYVVDSRNEQKKKKKMKPVDGMKNMLKNSFKGGPEDLSTNDWYLYGPDVK